MAMIGQRMTADEFLELDVPERPRLWLVDGTIVVNSPNRRHQKLVAYLLLRLGTWAEDGFGRGEVGLELDHPVDARNVYAPDLWWSPETWAEPVPAIVIEVSSPSTARYDRGVKRDRYLTAGVLEVWVVDTDHDVVEIGDRVLAAEDSITSPLLPGFSLSVRQLFDR